MTQILVAIERLSDTNLASLPRRGFGTLQVFGDYLYSGFTLSTRVAVDNIKKHLSSNTIACAADWEANWQFDAMDHAVVLGTRREIRLYCAPGVDLIEDMRAARPEVKFGFYGPRNEAYPLWQASDFVSVCLYNTPLDGIAKRIQEARNITGKPVYAFTADDRADSELKQMYAVALSTLTSPDDALVLWRGHADDTRDDFILNMVGAVMGGR